MATAAVASVALAGCGAQPANGSDVKKAAQYTGSDRQQYLEKCAKKEGTLTVYTAQNTDLWTKLRAGFVKKYPYVKTNTTRRTSTETAVALTKEASSHVNKADVIDVKVEVAEGLLDLFAPYTSPQLSAYPQDVMGTGHKYVVSDEIPYGVAYNTDKISAADAPKTSADLLKPEFKGKIGMSTTLLGTQWIGWMLKKYGVNFIKQLGKQSIHTSATNTDAFAAQVASGESLIAPAVSLSGVQSLKDSGKPAPVKWVPIDSQWTQGALAIAANAPHPCSAMLYIDYELSKEGQTVNPLYLSARKDVQPNPALKDIKPATVWDIIGSHKASDYNKASKQWTQLIDQYIVGH